MYYFNHTCLHYYYILHSIYFIGICISQRDFHSLEIPSYDGREDRHIHLSSSLHKLYYTNGKHLWDSDSPEVCSSNVRRNFPSLTYKDIYILCQHKKIFFCSSHLSPKPPPLLRKTIIRCHHSVTILP